MDLQTHLGHQYLLNEVLFVGQEEYCRHYVSSTIGTIRNCFFVFYYQDYRDFIGFGLTLS